MSNALMIKGTVFDSSIKASSFACGLNCSTQRERRAVGACIDSGSQAPWPNAHSVDSSASRCIRLDSDTFDPPSCRCCFGHSAGRSKRICRSPPEGSDRLKCTARASFLFGSKMDFHYAMSFKNKKQFHSQLESPEC